MIPVRDFVVRSAGRLDSIADYCHRSLLFLSFSLVLCFPFISRSFPLGFTFTCEAKGKSTGTHGETDSSLCGFFKGVERFPSR